MATALSTDQLRVLDSLPKTGAWRTVAEVAAGLHLTHHKTGCILKGLYIRGLTDMQQYRAPTGKGDATAVIRSYRITKQGKRVCRLKADADPAI